LKSKCLKHFQENKLKKRYHIKNCESFTILQKLWKFYNFSNILNVLKLFKNFEFFERFKIIQKFRFFLILEKIETIQIFKNISKILKPFKYSRIFQNFEIFQMKISWNFQTFESKIFCSNYSKSLFPTLYLENLNFKGYIETLFYF